MASRIYEVYITIPPDGGYSWVIAAISFFGYAIADGIGSSFYLYRKRISQDLGISTPMSAAIGSTYSSLCLFTGPIVSSLCNLYGFRWILITGGILTSSGMGLAYFCKNFPTMLLLFGIITGIGGGCALIPITAPVGYWFDKKRPIALGGSSAGSGIGMLVVPYTTHKIMDMYGWKSAFIYHSALFSLYIVLGIFLISLPPMLLKPEDTTQSRLIPQVGEAHRKKIKAHNKYHKAASEIFPSSVYLQQTRCSTLL
ncbi:monocarboxylate transporter 3-like [Rhodnius prolixus]|uniref:monocarboxylate transporter 3-like n=1 Tax=Rhodnius prolixus TaxID=13249 RepID=UPI003D18E5D3